MSPIRMQRVESGVRVVIAFNEAFNRHDLPAMLQLLSDDCVFEETQPRPRWHPVHGQSRHLRVFAGVLPPLAPSPHQNRRDLRLWSALRHALALRRDGRVRRLRAPARGGPPPRAERSHRRKALLRKGLGLFVETSHWMSYCWDVTTVGTSLLPGRSFVYGWGKFDGFIRIKTAHRCKNLPNRLIF